MTTKYGVLNVEFKRGHDVNSGKIRLEIIWDEVQQKTREQGLGWIAPTNPQPEKEDGTEAE